jgi:sec-independent protein translocase protein TatA
MTPTWDGSYVFRNPTTDVLIVLFIVLIIFGPKRIPMLGKELGRGIREFKDSITTSSKDAEAAERAELEQGAAANRVDATSSPAQPAASAAERPAASAPEREH